jgi:hypothetical protein
MDYQIGYVPDRASRARSVPHHSLSHAANDEFFHGCPSCDSSMLSQQRQAAFPSERDVRAERSRGIRNTRPYTNISVTSRKVAMWVDKVTA